jgi:hypothetical protein
MIGLYGLCLGGFLTWLIASLDNGLSRNPLGSNSIRLFLSDRIGWMRGWETFRGSEQANA